jgi:protein-disulfide isomerase
MTRNAIGQMFSSSLIGLRPRVPASTAALALTGVALILGCGSPSDAPATSAGSRTVVATIGSEQVTEAEVAQRIRGRLVEIELERYNALKEGLEEVIAERLIEQEAAARDTTVEQLLEDEVERRISLPSTEDVDQFYAENEAQLSGQALEDLRPRIELYLQEQRRADRREELIDELRSTREVAIRLRPPTVEVSASGPARGAEDAKVTIVEFSDFGCPYCARAAQTLDKVMETYGDRVRLVYRHYPLQPDSQRVAEAAACAAELGAFWQFHDLLFANQGEFGDESLKDYASRAGLDEQAFVSCLESGRAATVVEQDAADGDGAGVNGTPSFFVNGRPLSGALPYEEFEEAIEEALAQT